MKERILFYGSRAAQYGFMSNFSRHQYKRNGHWYQTVEHDYQSQKFAGTAMEKKIREAKGPGAAKRLGQSPGIRKDWESVKENVMMECLRAKFKAHPAIAKELLETGDAELVEDSPTDFYWGCGDNGKGKNRLGVLLMKLREEIRAKH